MICSFFQRRDEQLFPFSGTPPAIFVTKAACPPQEGWRTLLFPFVVHFAAGHPPVMKPRHATPHTTPHQSFPLPSTRPEQGLALLADAQLFRSRTQLSSDNFSFFGLGYFSHRNDHPPCRPM